MPSEFEVSNLVVTSENQYGTHIVNAERAKRIPDVDELPGQKVIELSKTPVELKWGDWLLKVVPWIGGRVISMMHLPSGTQWLHSRVEVNGYEEYNGVEYRSAGCSEEYKVVEKNLEQSGEEESLCLEEDVGGGLILECQISIPKDFPKVLRIDSSIIGRSVGAGSGGYSRLHYPVSRWILLTLNFEGWFVCKCMQCSPSFTPLKFLLHSLKSMVQSTKSTQNLESNHLKEVSSLMGSGCWLTNVQV